jgi:hypothetical protein
MRSVSPTRATDGGREVLASPPVRPCLHAHMDACTCAAATTGDRDLARCPRIPAALTSGAMLPVRSHRSGRAE